MIKFKFLFVFLFTYCLNYGQHYQDDDIECPITQNQQLLSGKLYASAKPVLLRVYNEEFEYAVFQLGKRKRKIFLYFKIFTDNVCVKQKQPLVLKFESGEKYFLQNTFNVNCNGTATLELTRRDIKKLMNNNINVLSFHTLKKDYEFHPSDNDNQLIKLSLHCLKIFKIRKIR